MSEEWGSTDRGGTFVDRLGELVLRSFAAGQTVEGQWFFVNGLPLVPDLDVSITGHGPRGRARSTEATVAGTDRRGFDEKLEAFLLAEFADGEPIEGVWNLRFSPAELPVWTVEIDLGELDFDGDVGESPLGARNRR